MDKAYIYALVDPRDQQIRYVGKANIPLSRLVSHFRMSENEGKDSWIKELQSEGVTPYVKVLEEVAYGAWSEHERAWVKRLVENGCKLLNINLMPRQPFQSAAKVTQATLIGMPEAARRAGTARNTIKRALENAGVPLVQIHQKAFAVDEVDLANFLAGRPAGYKGRGRPAGAKNKLKENKPQEGEESKHDDA